MKNFPNLLDRFLTDNKDRFTAQTFAESASVHNGDLSRVRSGSKEPTTEFVHKILTAPLLPISVARQLTVAFLRDEVPDLYSRDIRITIEDWITSVGQTRDILDEALEYFRQESRADSDTHAWFTGLYKTISGKKG